MEVESDACCGVESRAVLLCVVMCCAIVMWCAVVFCAVLSLVCSSSFAVRSCVVSSCVVLSCVASLFVVSFGASISASSASWFGHLFHVLQLLGSYSTFLRCWVQGMYQHVVGLVDCVDIVLMGRGKVVDELETCCEVHRRRCL